MSEESTVKRPAHSFDCVQEYLISLGYAYSEVTSCYAASGLPKVTGEDIARYSTPSEIERWLKRTSIL